MFAVACFYGYNHKNFIKKIILTAVTIKLTLIKIFKLKGSNQEFCLPLQIIFLKQ
jgi:hypothetical protein